MASGMRTKFAAIVLGLAMVVGCVGGDDPLDGEGDSFPLGKADGGIEEGSAEARAILALVNDPVVTFEELDDDARLNKRAARNIIDNRDYATLAELDAVPYVGPYALQQLLEYAIAQGYLDAESGTFVDVIFSPQQYANSHNVRVAELIDGAQTSLDIAMYSYSDAGIGDALEAAVDRGVDIRFIFETANDDRKKTGSDLENSKSARLEKMGINVRYVNKIMHHKFMIVDGPRDDISAIDTATVVTGSGNWSNGAATRYDENTLFFSGHRELTMEMQAEFNHLWNNSRDFVWDATLPYELSSYDITEELIEDAPGTDAYFTSDNFTVSNTTFRITGANTVSDALVEAIWAATDSIHVMSGHLRSRPVAEALMAKYASDPSLDVRVYLDGQEYISSWYHNDQRAELDDCLVDATTESQRRKCLDKGFYFGYELALAGIDVRYKYYAYRWHYSYAVQMHNKVMVIDGDEVWTGSYNLSDNAEHNTMENMLVFRSAEFAELAAAYENTFANLWETGRADDLLGELRDEVETSSSVPLVFDPMALTWEEVTDLKALIKDNCADINSESFRTSPEQHWYCPRS